MDPAHRAAGSLSKMALRLAVNRSAQTCSPRAASVGRCCGLPNWLIRAQRRAYARGAQTPQIIGRDQRGSLLQLTLRDRPST